MTHILTGYDPSSNESNMFWYSPLVHEYAVDYNFLEISTNILETPTLYALFTGVLWQSIIWDKIVY